MSSTEKINRLQQWGLLNTKPGSIKDQLFSQCSFFDPRDLLQVKYEMLRHVYVDGWGITQATSSFGFSRPTFYRLDSLFKDQGLSGLLPLKTGPKEAHKLTPEVIAFIEHQRAIEKLTWKEIVEAAEKQFYPMHLRTAQRALWGKK